MRSRFQYISIIVLLLCACVSMKAQDFTERVIRFQSDVVLKADNYVEITEHICIYAKGDIFKRGLRRVLPQHRYDKYGHSVDTPIYLQEIKCNGVDSPWHSEEAEDSNDLIIYIGDADTYLETGEYDYTIRYVAPGQIGCFDDYDEIYWNLNGFGWDVPFDTLSATVTIPEGTSIMNFVAYTGQEGEAGNAYTAQADSTNQVTFTSTKAFGRGENMTIAVDFTKGSQKELSWWQTWKDDVYAGLASLAFILFCIITWIKVGIDPKKPTVIPQYTIPKGISPALAGRILSGSTNEQQVVATLISMVMKGGATINRRSKTEYDFKIGSKSNLDAFEKDAFLKLFSDKEVISTKDNSEELGVVRNAIQKKTNSEYNSKYYIHNAEYISIAILLGIGLLFFLSCLNTIEDTFLICLFGCIAVYIWYTIVIGKYTLNGIQARSDMEGLKMYIKTAEELQMRDLTPEHFEEMLPYAIAFGVENKWCKQFENVLKQCEYEPKWYTTADAAYTYRSLLLSNNGMHSLTSGISKATTSSFTAYDSAHASSSGGSWSSGGGGGFSGGGGGGGGGGGW